MPTSIIVHVYLQRSHNLHTNGGSELASYLMLFTRRKRRVPVERLKGSVATMVHYSSRYHRCYWLASSKRIYPIGHCALHAQFRSPLCVSIVLPNWRNEDECVGLESNTRAWFQTWFFWDFWKILKELTEQLGIVKVVANVSRYSKTIPSLNLRYRRMADMHES